MTRLLLSSLLLISFHAFAEDTPPPQGWSKAGTLGANLSFSSSQGVVGQTDGTSQTYGAALKAGTNYNDDNDEWRNSLSLLENTSKTPTIPHFVKSADELKLQSIYLYKYQNLPKVGPYANLEAEAPIFKGEDVRTSPQTYAVKRNGVTERTFNDSSTRLTDGFKPLTTKESVGAYWKPVQDEKIKVEARLGLGAMQIGANGQFSASSSPNSSGQIELTPLSDVNQVGLEAALNVKGKVNDSSTYEAGVETMTPFVNNKAADDTRDAWGLTNIEGYAKYSSHITSWAALSYDYKLKIQPQLVTAAQQIHMLVLNLNYSLF